MCHSTPSVLNRSKEKATEPALAGDNLLLADVRILFGTRRSLKAHKGVSDLIWIKTKPAGRPFPNQVRAASANKCSS
jgi:hypothetical protein